jgi:hypothetical protein
MLKVLLDTALSKILWYFAVVCLIALNKPGVAAEFCPPTEILAFPIVDSLERGFQEIWAEPLPLVIKALTGNKTVEQVFENLPDIKVINKNHP